MRKIITLFLLSVITLSGCQQKLISTAKYPPSGIVKKEVFKEIITSKNVQLVDVRTPEEFLAGHLEKAQNINYNDPEFKQLISAQLNKTKPVALYCRSGRRSAAALLVLRELGFKTVYDLEGGFLNWQSVPK